MFARQACRALCHPVVTRGFASTANVGISDICVILRLLHVENVAAEVHDSGGVGLVKLHPPAQPVL